MNLQLFPKNEEVLRRCSLPITNVDGALVQQAEQMLEMMYEYEGVGLAAIQVGLAQRLFVMDVSKDCNDPQYFFNPEIVESHETITWEEGCLSIPTIHEQTERKQHILVRAIGLDGESFEREFSDLGAVCVQHEIDHLNGILFIDQLSRLKYQRIRRKMQKYWSEQG